jgi:hypothetical protein
MKYSININQGSIADHGLSGKTDLTDWAIVDYIKDWQANPKAERYQQMIWFNFSQFIKQMPLLGITSKGAVSKRIKKLFDLGLIDVFQEKNSRVFVELTQFCVDVIMFKGSSKSTQKGFPKETGVSQSEQGVSQSEQGVSQSEQGVSDRKHSIDHHLTAHQNKNKEKPAGKSTETWNAYSYAYLGRYPRAPYRDASVNSLLCKFVDKVGKEDAPFIAAYYLTLDDQWYVKKGHDVATLLQNAQSIANQWAAGTNNTSINYRQNERTNHNLNVANRVIAKLQASGEIE